MLFLTIKEDVKMFCSKCGNECADTSKFCNSCGNMLTPPQTESETVNAEPEVINIEPEAIENAALLPNEEEAVIDSKEAVEVYEQNETIDYSQQLIQPVENVEEMPAVIEDVEEEPAEDSIIVDDIVENNINVDDKVAISEAEIASVEENAPAEDEEVADTDVAEEPEKVAKKKGFMSYVGLVFCYMLLLIFCVTGISGVIAKISINPKQLKNDLSKIDALGIEIGSIIVSNEYDVEEDDTIQDIIFKTIEANSSFEIKKSHIKDIYENTEIKNYITQKVADYAEYITTGKNIKEITTSDIVNIIVENKDEIEKIADIKITDNSLKSIEYYLDNNASELMEALSKDKVDETLKEYNYSDYEFLFNNWFWIFGFSSLGVLIILFTVFIFKLNKNTGRSIVYLGSIAITVGSLFLVGGAVLFIIKKSIVSAFAEAGGVVNAILPLLTFRIILFGAIIFTIGLLTVLIKKLVCLIKNSKNKPEQIPQEA